MEKPVEPAKEDCCNSGCNPCIFDIYERQLTKYKKHLESGQSVNDNILQKNGISQLKYTIFNVVKNLPACHLHNCITFKNVSEGSNKVWWKPGDHFLYKFNEDNIACTRAYTPIEAKNEQTEGDFSIIVKKYEHGLVSTHLCNLNEGDTTLWRGPYGHYEHEPNKFNRIIMIAQGTGISPFITIINKILNNEDDMTKIILFYCCKCDNSILFRDELYAYKSYWNFKYNIYLSSTSTTNFVCRYQEPINKHKLMIEYLYNLKPFVKSDQILICGAPIFNESYKTYLKSEVPDIDNIVLF
ncbi:hypothetical protein PYW07_015188 [Mythimna separata]|uniref:NADH-cytochrome b5 reductase n=1 Tax=Mythimna separata TaxID=271217 RepID=A0AAD8DZ99_MYTSE|nr:hypothetical protein PYW07_015188 [Mythimna separata]